jgi:hypothetical protein
MTRAETVTLTQTEYEALLKHNSELEDRLAALEAEDGSGVPHEVAADIIRGKSPILSFPKRPRLDPTRSLRKHGNRRKSLV